MLTFYGRAGRTVFLRAALLRIVLFAASVIGFPFLLIAVTSVSGCAGIGGACGAVALLLSTAVKPLAFVLLVFSFAGISMRRTYDAGMPAWLGLIIPLFLAINYHFFVYSWAPWSFAFSAGVLYQSFPRFAALAIYCMVILCILPSRAQSEDKANPFGTAGFIAFGLVLSLLCLALPGVLIAVMGIQPWTLPLGTALRVVMPATPYVMIGVVAVLGWIAWRYRVVPQEMQSSTASPSEASERPRPPIGWLLAAALALALLMCGYVLDKSLGTGVPLALVVNANSIVLPTMVLCFFPLLGIWLVSKKPSLVSVLVLMVALTPFLHWGYSHWRAFEDHRLEVAEIAAIPTKLAHRVPPTLVYEATGGSVAAAWALPQIQHVIVKGGFNSSLLQFERPLPIDGPFKQSKPAALPDEYLLLRVGRSSGFAKKDRIYSTAGGPFELRYIDQSHDDLVAVWYRAFNPSPSILPVLTSNGWYRGPNSATTTEVDSRINEFLIAALKSNV